MTVIAIILLIIIVWLVFGESIKRALYRYMARKAEDTLRRSMGMPPRDDRKKRRSRQQDNAGGSRRRQQSRSDAPESPVIPREYAEDVEYVEIRSYSEETVIEGESAHSRTAKKHPSGERTILTESQIEEAEIISITRDDDGGADTFQSSDKHRR